MALDVVDLREFYISPLGRAVRRLLRTRLSRLWPEMAGEAVLALGYATPLLRPWLKKAAFVVAVMPEAQGVAYWPKEGPNISCLADPCALPLPENHFSRVVLFHALETANDPDGVLSEVWRVLKPGGRMLVIVPNRRGFWAHRDDTPFGSGRPFSRGQIRALLKEQGFLVERSGCALYWPPSCAGRLSLLCAGTVERLGAFFGFAFGGLLILEASKQIYAPTFLADKLRSRRLILPLSTPSKPVGVG